MVPKQQDIKKSVLKNNLDARIRLFFWKDKRDSIKFKDIKWSKTFTIVMLFITIEFIGND